MQNSPIARTARLLRFAVLIAMLLVVAIYLAGRFGIAAGPVRVESALFRVGGIGPWIADLAIILFTLALWQLAKMLSAIASGPIFAPPVTASFRNFALLLFLSTLVDVLALPLIAVIQATAGPGHAAIALKFELRDLMLLAGSLFLFLLARMMDQARAYEAELEEIV